MVVALLGVGLLIGVVAAGVGAIFEAHRRTQLLATMNFRTHGPVVPGNVLRAVRGAEARAYEDMGIGRRLVEDAQDALALLWPGFAFSRDFSLGPYRIKASTVRTTLDFALNEGYLTLSSAKASRYSELLPFFVLQPSISDWPASVLLEYLRQRHPGLARMTWGEIAADPAAIAKLYSGYMGAGGDWERWAAHLVPGDVSRARLGYEPTTGRYAGIDPSTPIGLARKA